VTTQPLKIDGMTCGGCANSVTKALMGVPGVVDVRVSLAEGRAEVDASQPVDLALLTSAVEKKGFRATIA